MIFADKVDQSILANAAIAEQPFDLNGFNYGYFLAIGIVDVNRVVLGMVDCDIYLQNSLEKHCLVLLSMKCASVDKLNLIRSKVWQTLYDWIITLILLFSFLGELAISIFQGSYLVIQEKYFRREGYRCY